jgi:hypothetical protein
VKAPPRGKGAYQRALDAYNRSVAEFEKTVARPYWTRVVDLQAQRRGRLVASYTDADFVGDAPPVRRGVAKPDPADFGVAPEVRPPSTLPVVKDFIAAADRVGFRFDLLRPDATAEQRKTFESAYRRRYAQVGLTAGLTAAQMVGVYTFETGGVGRHDTQAGLEFGGTRPISTALGYGQLLAANSNTTFSTDGELIAQRLDAEGKHEKAELVRRMQREVLAIHGRPPTWDEAQRIAKTDLGRACHAANLDIDIGPQLQTVKLAGIITSYNAQATRNGMPVVTMAPEVLEMMNLAGVELGFQAAHPSVGARLTVNFFDQEGYEANPVAARGRTGAGLVATIRNTMAGDGSRAEGSREFRRIFDELGRLRP